MKHLSRRLFMQESLLAAAAMALPARAVFAEETPRPAGGPSERLNVAVIGVNGRGRDHAKAYAARGDCVLSHICDADEKVGRAFAEGFEGKPKFVQDLRRIFDDKSVDVVSIATPNHWHSLAAIWAMQAGKNVYVEKPVSHNISEGRRMVQTSRKYNRICQGGTQIRSTGAARAAAQYVRAGKLGQIKLAHVCTYRPRTSIGPAGAYPPPETVDYNLWAGPAPMESPLRRKSFHYDWHWFWNYGGGELANNSIHHLDTARMILDLKGLGKGVLSYGGRVGLDDCGETPSVQVTVHDFGPITVVQEVRNLKTADPPRGVTLIVGSEGYLADDSVYDPDGKLVEKLTGPDVDHFGNFIQAVKSRKREEQNAEINEGHISTAVIHVANISQRLGKPASASEIQQALEGLKVNENVIENFREIRRHLADNAVDMEKTPLALGPWIGIDSEKERFIDNPAADAMLTREYRKPFVVPGEKEV
ncbi:MAG TPA: Gfo/Idh/MocA family oxidoreductase [Tepidisphaeraceae bacterium]|jgi:predicted dehydrogenase|nr:Gfo/Idh/MocA family oxidoreductase [Tepidisphaeraceae bacterium]